MMPCVEPFRIMITIVVANHFPNTSPWDKFNKLTKYWLSGKKITFVHGCLKCGNLKLTIRGQSPPYSLYYFLPDTSDLRFEIYRGNQFTFLARSETHNYKEFNVF